MINPTRPLLRTDPSTTAACTAADPEDGRQVNGTNYWYDAFRNKTNVLVAQQHGAQKSLLYFPWQLVLPVGFKHSNDI